MKTRRTFKQWLSDEWEDTRILFRNIPAVFVSLFVVSVVLMNILANKTIQYEWFAMDCGTLISWLAFLTADIMTKRFGPKAATKVSILALLINLLCCGLFALIAVIGGIEGMYSEGHLQLAWGAAIEYTETGSYLNTAANASINNTLFSGIKVLVSSSLGFLISAIVNNFLNFGINTLFKSNPDSVKAYVCSSYISTAIGQFVDNLVFAIFAFVIFHIAGEPFTFSQVMSSACLGMILELVFQIVFSPIGYKMIQSWKKDNVGKEYLDYVESKVKA